MTIDCGNYDVRQAPRLAALRLNGRYHTQPYCYPYLCHVRLPRPVSAHTPQP
ncbi:MAG: hypothetical protein H6658_06035 [Ardenticatenaceae bacterium]|nr:hypothetical protein [Ardenticatenaceae bacterium]